MICRGCETEFEATSAQSWENACPRCGRSAWLARGMVLPVRVVGMVEQYYRTRHGYMTKLDELAGARVTAGDGLRGLMYCDEKLEPGEQVLAEVVSVNHSDKLIMLKHNPDEHTGLPEREPPSGTGFSC